MVNQETIAGAKNDETILWCVKGLVATSEQQGHGFQKKNLIFHLKANWRNSVHLRYLGQSI